MHHDDAISLHQLNQAIKSSVRESFSNLIWVVAEINQFNLHSSGHCYLELIEKEASTDHISASIRGNIWASTYSRLSAFFRTSTGLNLAAGIKVLIKVQVDFHEVYGISLNIRDIDPSFTMGDMARKRSMVIKRLEDEGIIDMNRELVLPRVVQRIAVISSASAAGYEDFIEQLKHNSRGFVFYPRLFTASMQGSQTASSIIMALDRIAEYADFFEAVVIIRGGGSKTDLSFFDDYDLAYYLTQFPLPVITGIGHERDESVCDLVANTSCKTPTAAAAYLLDLAEDFESELLWFKDQISREARKTLTNNQNTLLQNIQSIKLNARYYQEGKKHQLQKKVHKTESVTQKFLTDAQEPLLEVSNGLSQKIRYFLLSESSNQSRLFKKTHHLASHAISLQNHKLDLVSKECEHLNPENILRRGYSITYFKGKPVKDISQLHSGDRIRTRIKNGEINSTLD